MAGRARAELLLHLHPRADPRRGRDLRRPLPRPRAGAENAALRLRQTRPVLQFSDRLRGTLIANEPLAREDFIIHRRDGLFAYNGGGGGRRPLSGITEIVRGADLIEPTVRQISLYQHFGWQAPDYLHLPLALNGDGNKLSKQNHAPALPEGDPRPEIVRALRFLNQAIPEEWQALSIDDLLARRRQLAAGENRAFSNGSR